ncbi:HAD-IIA family hydrolase [Paenibacillus arenilitoris]|uniref:HAD-IIA family hydrolase n=1 Tax=Paenibacillus arenilitoris TaxID=2772299 RepID=A0A927CIT0_9BACL|nr:HAD-IIA family hydrolase [Paenibacillus arenilitoris]MBD2868873.1 HAD-IIA family hydrolase [Paenibacillus arenilitoris]
MTVKGIEGFIIDLDGTVYKGKQPIPGAVEAIAELKRRGMKTVFLSNRGNISRKMCKAKLSAMGLDVPEEEILLSSTVTANFLSAYYSSSPVWTLGDAGLREELAAAGLAMADKPESAEWLVITLHETLTYKELNDAFRAVRSGARIIATNADKTFPGDEGDSIDVAGMIGAIVSSTGKEVELVIGKPSSIMAEAALRAIGLPPASCLVVGDSLASDIQLGKKAGMRTALVLTGSAKREDAEASEWQPDWIWDSLADAARAAAFSAETEAAK